MPMTISHIKSNTIADWSGVVTVGDSTGGRTTVQASDLIRPSDWNSAHSMVIDGNGFYEPFMMEQSNSVNEAPGMGTWYLYPVQMPLGLSRGAINIFCERNSSIFLNGVSANSTLLGGMSITGVHRNCIAFYSQGTGGNASILTTVWTAENAISATWSQTFAGATSGMTGSNYLTLGINNTISTQGQYGSSTFTASGTFSTGTTSMASTKIDSLITAVQNFITGSCMDRIGMSTALAPGVYWIGQMFTTGSGGAGTTGVNRTTALTLFNASQSRAAMLHVNLSAYKRLGSTTSPNSSSQYVGFQGTLGTTTSQATANIQSSDLQNYSRRIYWNYLQDTK